MRFRCVNGICVLQRHRTPDKIGMIQLPESVVSAKKSELATVLEACPEWREDGATRHTALKPGDTVCISRYSGQDFEIGGQDNNWNIVLVKEKDILCILDGYEKPQDAQSPGAMPHHESPATLIVFESVA